ncbi:ABC transporter ATP-binding protein [Streptobacillus moniliformis]|uniref:ABC transporter related protein n=1 Tax=Streptobacillus moniliformis (strain ATCC 14647 / DSM 12112 / NCTC 10651 / 9901) TaxID=519441 RepID=D1AV06_STRM9|nr:ABC transporter ATP-binding protein [Streptobacillus moniliformis]ACZ01566.1 ABC transporter related protein [Streptobacillus moniliformis DSM 12112]AVL43438.1 ABC transporter ATP-binding protein [Streptobacillus moniliformis]QXW66238.1 ABC transporter ATP-binding protein/permease [Streptobacillus moniliformis]SQA13266.1 Probable multidrug resistance ABC transporter ATP-binding/permease protein YheH [Streptobacillus moniliformis]
MENKNYLFDFFKFMKKAKKEYTIGLIVLLIGMILEIGTIKLIAIAFDKEIESIDVNKVFSFVGTIALIYVSLKILEAVFMVYRKKLLQIAANIVYTNIQILIYNHVQRLPIKYFDDIPAGSVLSKITSDVKAIRTFFSETLLSILIVLSQLGIIYSVMMYINWRLSLILLIYVPIVIILQKYNKSLTYTYSSDIRKYNSICNGRANEMCQNLEVVAAFNNQEALLKDWENSAHKRYESDRIITLLESFFSHNIFDFLTKLAQLTIIFYYIYSATFDLGLITAGDTLVFIFYISNIINGLSNFTVNLSYYYKAKGSAKNISELLNLNIEDENDLIKPEKIDGNIKFENVYFAYEDEYVLKDVNLEIKENQTVAFVGHTGSGKSTIMNLLVKFYKNQKGKIEISGLNIKDIDTYTLRDNIAIVLQDSFLFEGTIGDNISEDKEIARNALEMVGAKYILDERGLDGKVMQDGNNFSTGEKQLISFARALAKNPKILILDEATANVDSKTEQIIQNGIEILKKNRTTLIIAHRLSTIRNADKIFVLDKGKIVESGNHEKLVELNGLYNKMLKLNNSK